MALGTCLTASATSLTTNFKIHYLYAAGMLPYGTQPKHTPSPGPRQPKPLDEADPAVQAERERVLAIVADMGKRAARGEYDHLDRRGVLAVVWLRVKHER